MENQAEDVAIHVVPESIEIGDFIVAGDCLRADVKLILSGRSEGKDYPRSEELTLFVEPHGDEIGVAVYDSILDFSALAVLAEHVASKLNTTAGKAALKLASKGSGPKRRWLPKIRVSLSSSTATAPRARATCAVRRESSEGQSPPR
jgi:hypothetical protein